MTFDFKKRGYKRNIPLLYVFSALTAGLFTVPVWITFQQEFLTFTQMAFFNSLFFILILIFELPTGAFADIAGRKLSITLGTIFNAIGHIYIGLNPSISSMYVFVIANGLGAALISGAKQSLVYDTLIEIDQVSDYPRISAQLTLYFQVLASAAILAGGYVFAINSGLPYILRGVFCFIGVLPTLFLVEPLIDSEIFTWKNYVKQTKMGIREAFKTRYLAKLSLWYVLLKGIVTSNHRFFSQPFMLEFGLSEVQRSWIASIIKLFIAFLTVYLASRKKLFSSKYYLTFIPIIMILSLLPAHFVSWPFLLIILVGVALPSGGVSTFLGYPLQLHIASKYRATALSALNMVASLVYAINNTLGGFVVELFSVSWYYFSVGLFVLLVVVPLTVNIVRSKE